MRINNEWELIAYQTGYSITSKSHDKSLRSEKNDSERIFGVSIINLRINIIEYDLIYYLIYNIIIFIYNSLGVTYITFLLT